MFKVDDLKPIYNLTFDIVSIWIVLQDFDYVFSENGLVAYEAGKLIGTESIQNFMGEEKLQKFINFSLNYMSKLTLPVKRGTFIEFRNGMINVCPVGRSCSQAERIQFFNYDQVGHAQWLINNIRLSNVAY